MRFIWRAIFLVLVAPACDQLEGEVVFAEPESQSDYNYPYFLFIPDKLPDNEKVVLIVEPNNSGFVSDELSRHIEKAERQATLDFYIGNYVANALEYPLLVPAFPRSETNWKIYTHALDRDAMMQYGNDLERMDLQLLAMVDEAQEKLRERGYLVDQQILMTGFSASGTFASRFSLLHPEKLKAVAAGGLNGLLMLPVDSLNGRALPYPLGTADLKLLTDRTFDRNAFQNLPQYWFMGKLDDNDAIPFEDGYDPEERDLVFEVLGEEMQPTRWNNCRQVYTDAGINAQILTYEGLGHEHPQQVKEDILAFFKKALAKEVH